MAYPQRGLFAGILALTCPHTHLVNTSLILGAAGLVGYRTIEYGSDAQQGLGQGAAHYLQGGQHQQQASDNSRYWVARQAENEAVVQSAEGQRLARFEVQTPKG